MSVPARTDPVSHVDTGVTVGLLHLDVSSDGDRCVVRVTGELDRASRDHLFAACTAGDHRQMLIDLSALTFMDCGGYGGLVASRLLIEGDSRTLTIRGITGQPKRLVDTIERFQVGSLPTAN